MKTLAEYRIENNMTQKDLAELLDVTAGAIGMWETGKRTPCLKKAIDIASVFNVSVEDILFSKDQN